jgi:peptide-methionine (S)-S-oxide reductase
MTDTTNGTTPELATFAAGCFWGVEAAFRKVPGVVATTVGYTGGHTDHPTYADVCSHTTGHAEAVEVAFDPALVSYDELLDVFWHEHDATQDDLQGLVPFDNYRNEIFVHSPEQGRAALASRARLQARTGRPVVTGISSASTFWPAEEHHQRYLEKAGRATCATTVANRSRERRSAPATS